AVVAVLVGLIAGGFTLGPGARPSGGVAQAGEPPARTETKAPSPVQQLGSAIYTEREAAPREIIEMGARGPPAVRAGLNDSNTEIARRCAAILPLLTVEELKAPNHPAWARFRKLVGDTDASRKMFLDMIDDPRRATILEAAEANPDRAGAIYKDELDLRVRAL